jgi:hypothetical protein
MEANQLEMQKLIETNHEEIQKTIQELKTNHEGIAKDNIGAEI